MRSGSDKASGANKGAKGGEDSRRNKTRSKQKTTHTKVQPSSHASSTKEDQQYTSHRASYPPTVNGTHDRLNSSTALIEYQEDSSIEFHKHEQSLDLLGIALQSSEDDLFDSKPMYPEDFIEPISQENTSACPVHSALLAGLQGTANSSSSLGSGMDITPMERYVTEGLAERYALLQVNQAATEGDWARYSTCSCFRK